MNISTKAKQWLWFIGLWCAGLLTVVVVASVIKLFMYGLKII